jgi:CheY-like chemotaxis protein
VESALGKGTTFEIYLPHATSGAASPEKEESLALHRGTETILVVEDEAAVRELACQFLHDGGYTVLNAKDGVDAVEIAARHQERIDLVLSDMVMPRMSGTELAAHLKGKRPDAKILFMTGYAGYSAQRGNEGAMMLQKPFSRPSLLSKVREALAEAPAKEVSERDVRLR